MAVRVDIPKGLEKLLDHPGTDGSFQSPEELIQTALRTYLTQQGLVEENPLSAETIQELDRARDEASYDSLDTVEDRLGL